jgi:RNA polymerase sigma-70 factor, ECF subfamily
VAVSEYAPPGDVVQADDLLLEQVRRGDAAAFETIFVRHYGAVYRVLRHLTERHEVAEDLAQETFLAFHREPPRPETNVLAWLLRVALNRGYNALRGERRERQRIERHAPPDAHDPQTALLQAEERALVRSALAQLPQREGQMLLLRHSGLSYAEVAAVIGVAPGSVGTLLVRAERAFVAAYERVQVDDDASA